ncbi:MAG: hypothetical protein ACKV2V_23180 [Blastocatellia bacterium]
MFRCRANLWTACIVALNPDTGKLVWYFQPSPHDTRDRDNVETPVLFDAVIKGQPRKLPGQAARAGWFFVLDRATGKNLVSKPFTGTGNWAMGVDAKGTPIWHQRLTAPVSNGPSTWMLDGKQYLIVGAGDTLYAMTQAGKPRTE